VRTILFFLAFLIYQNTFSQERKILGRILDSETQTPIQNANVFIPGTTLTGSTNRLGFFEMTIDPLKHKTLVASHIGFKTSTIDVPSEERFKFSLEKEYILLSQLNLEVYPNDTLNNPRTEQPQSRSDSNLVMTESGAAYPGGIVNFYDYMGNSLAGRLPAINEVGINVTFTINEKGQAVDITLSDSTSTEFTTRAVLESFQKMPNWRPAMQGSINVSQHFSLPVVRIRSQYLESFDLVHLYSYLTFNIKYPVQALRMGLEGPVYVEFQVNESGNVNDVKILKDIGAGSGEEVEGAISRLPIGLTGSLYNKTGATKFVLPVCFGLERPFLAHAYTPAFDSYLLDPVYVVGRDGTPTVSSEEWSRVDKLPEFPGGMSKFLSYIEKEFKCSGPNRGVDKKIFIEFVLDDKGYIEKESIKILKGDLSKVCKDNLARTLGNCPKWKPGRSTKLDKYVPVKMVLPIKFG